MPTYLAARRVSRFACAALVTVALLVPGCGGQPAEPPAQQAVEQSWRRTDQVVQQAAEAEQQVRHERRLRDIDRLRSQAELAELTSQLALLRGLLVACSATLLALAIWLAIEIRRRRVLTFAIQALPPNQGGEPRPTSNPGISLSPS
jgi:hypothetical protein